MGSASSAVYVGSSVALTDDLPLSLQTLIHSIAEQDSLTPARARELVLQANVSTEDVLPWADFDHSRRDSYGRKLVFHGGFFELMIMSWAPGDSSAIHDHGSTQWGAVQYFGPAEHAVFRVVDGVLQTVSREQEVPLSVNAVDHDLIHQMGNPTMEPFCSLHLYGSYDFERDVTGDARLFDLFEGKIQMTDGGVFFCLPEDQINRRVEGVPADPITTVRHHEHMLRRIYRMLSELEGKEESAHREKARRLEHEVALLKGRLSC